MKKMPMYRQKVLNSLLKFAVRNQVSQHMNHLKSFSFEEGT